MQLFPLVSAVDSQVTSNPTATRFVLAPTTEHLRPHKLGRLVTMGKEVPYLPTPFLMGAASLDIYIRPAEES